MGKYEKLLLKIIGGASDANIQFDELCNFLKHLDFAMRVKGSHHIFRKEGIAEKSISSVMGIWQNPIRSNKSETLL